MLDSNRDVAPRRSCYPVDADNALLCREHPGWRHATSWEEVDEALEQGALFADQDGDPIASFGDPIGDQGRRTYACRPGATHGYEAFYWQVMIEDVELLKPVTPEEEDEAIASILGLIE